MPALKTHAIVLRYANYGENDRMLTLLSPSLGLLSASARGCRKPSSRNHPASELFTAGEYQLYQKGERYTLTGFQMLENYFPLRNDVERLSHGVYWLNLCEAVAQPDEEAPRLFKMLLLSLAALAYGEAPPRALTAVFLIQFAMLQGFSPLLSACVRCGKPLAPPMRFDVEDGGVRCGSCGGAGLPLSEAGLSWLLEAQDKGAFMLAQRRQLPEDGRAEAAEEPFAILRAHVEHRLEKRLPSVKLL